MNLKLTLALTAAFVSTAAVAQDNILDVRENYNIGQTVTVTGVVTSDEGTRVRHGASTAWSAKRTHHAPSVDSKTRAAVSRDCNEPDHGADHGTRR